MNASVLVLVAALMDWPACGKAISSLGLFVSASLPQHLVRSDQPGDQTAHKPDVLPSP